MSPATIWYLTGMVTGFSVLAVMILILAYRYDTARERRIRRQARAGITALERVLREEADR